MFARTGRFQHFELVRVRVPVFIGKPVSEDFWQACQTRPGLCGFIQHGPKVVAERDYSKQLLHFRPRASEGPFGRICMILEALELAAWKDLAEGFVYKLSDPVILGDDGNMFA